MREGEDRLFREADWGSKTQIQIFEQTFKEFPKESHYIF